MEIEEAQDILLTAISEAYPIYSCDSFYKDYDYACKALDYLINLIKGDKNENSRYKE